MGNEIRKPLSAINDWTRKRRKDKRGGGEKKEDEAGPSGCAQNNQVPKSTVIN